MAMDADVVRVADPDHGATQTLDQKATEDNKLISDWLLHAEERRREFDRSRADILLHRPSGPVQTHHQDGDVSDPTGRSAERLATDKMSRTEAWLDLIRDVEDRLPERLLLVLHLRREARLRANYRGGRHGWVEYVQQRYCYEMAARHHQAEEIYWRNAPETYHDWWRRIVDYTAREAARRGLI